MNPIDIIGMVIAGGIVLWFFNLVTHPHKTTVQESPDEVLGRTVRRMFKLANRKDE